MVLLFLLSTKLKQQSVDLIHESHRSENYSYFLKSETCSGL